jgi:alkylation response protein AidB-like acyl-CoA dehydrogenase
MVGGEHSGRRQITYGLRGTGSHDFAVTDVFVPASHSSSFREPPVEPGPLYALPTIAMFSAGLAAVPLGIARHAIDILTALAGTKIASRSRQSIREDAILQVNLGHACGEHRQRGSRVDVQCRRFGLTLHRQRARALRA